MPILTSSGVRWKYLACEASSRSLSTERQQSSFFVTCTDVCTTLPPGMIRDGAGRGSRSRHAHMGRHSVCFLSDFFQRKISVCVGFGAYAGQVPRLQLRMLRLQVHILAKLVFAPENTTDGVRASSKLNTVREQATLLGLISARSMRCALTEGVLELHMEPPLRKRPPWLRRCLRQFVCLCVHPPPSQRQPFACTRCRQ